MEILKEKYSKNELAKEILKGLAVGGIIAAGLVLPNLPQILTLFGAKKSKDRFRIKKSLESLKRRKLVKFYKKAGKEIVEITREGKNQIQEYFFDEMKIGRPEKWDGFWRLVIFDIPESRKRGRDALSQKLKKIGFYPLQKSVFIHAFECKKEIDFICDFFDISQFIDYFLVKKIDKEKNLINFFNLE